MGLYLFGCCDCNGRDSISFPSWYGYFCLFLFFTVLFLNDGDVLAVLFTTNVINIFAWTLRSGTCPTALVTMIFMN